MGSSTAFNQVFLRIDLVSPINGYINVVNSVQAANAEIGADV